MLKKDKRYIKEKFDNFFKDCDKEKYGSIILINNFVGLPFSVKSGEFQYFRVAQRDNEGRVIRAPFDGIINILGIIDPDDREYTVENGEIELINLVGTAKELSRERGSGEVVEKTLPVYAGFKFTGDKPKENVTLSAAFSGFKKINSLEKKVQSEKIESQGNTLISLEKEVISGINSIIFNGHQLEEGKDFELADKKGTVIVPKYLRAAKKKEVYGHLNLLNHDIINRAGNLELSYIGFDKHDTTCYFFERRVHEIKENGRIELDVPFYVKIAFLNIKGEEYTKPKDIIDLLEFSNKQGISIRPVYMPEEDSKIEIIAETVYSGLSVKNLRKFKPGTSVELSYFGFYNDDCSVLEKKKKRRTRGKKRISR